MKFVPVDPKQFPDLREGRRGRVSYPLLKSFLETGLAIAKLDRTGMQQSLQALNSSLGAYIRNHNIPVRIANRGGEIYLIRTDAKSEKDVPPARSIEEYANEGKDLGVFVAPITPGPSTDAKAITPEEVAARFAKEKGNTTK